jgi:hypothetical protein
MSELNRDPFEYRTHALFQDSVESLDMAMRSRLNQARRAALDVAPQAGRAFLRRTWWTPAAGVTAAAILGAALWMGHPTQKAAVFADPQSNLEDLDIVASSDGGTGDAMEMLQDDIDFYDFADKAGSPEPAA